jgi:hypothetical protein
MSSSWSRFKQTTREVIGKSEKSETPQDITELAQNAEKLQKVYAEVIEKSGTTPFLPPSNYPLALITSPRCLQKEHWIVPVKARGAPAGRPLSALGSAWNLLAENYTEVETVNFLHEVKKLSPIENSWV